MCDGITSLIQEVGYDTAVHLLAMESISKPQNETPVYHKFYGGVYIREAVLPANSLIVGHRHKTDHLNMMLSGKMMMLKETGEWVIIEAPYMSLGKPGRKVAVTLEECVWQNIHPTTETSVEKVEEMFLEKDKFEMTNSQNIIDVEEDHEDFTEVCNLLGMTESEVHVLSTNEEDCIEFPDGVYKVIVAPSPIHGKGLFATASIKAGEVVCPARIGMFRTPAGRYINHSISSNVEMRMYENGDVDVVAMRDIAGNFGGELGEELTTDYYDAFTGTRYKLEESCQE